MKHILLFLIVLSPLLLAAQQNNKDGLYNTARSVNVGSITNDSSSAITVAGLNPGNIIISRISDESSFPKKIALTVYPNPAVSDTKAVFSAPVNGSDYMVTVFSMNGKPLFQKAGTTVAGTNTVGFNMSSYPTGTYLLQLYTGSQKQTVQLVKLQR